MRQVAGSLHGVPVAPASRPKNCRGRFTDQIVPASALSRPEFIRRHGRDPDDNGVRYTVVRWAGEIDAGLLSRRARRALGGLPGELGLPLGRRSLNFGETVRV